MSMPWGRSGSQTDATRNERADRQQRDRLATTAQGTYGQYEGDPLQSPFYKEEMGAATDQTAAAFNNARSRQSMKARMAGFGYNQPMAQADQTAVDLAQGQQNSSNQRQAAMDSANLGMQAAGGTSRLSDMYNSSAMGNMQVWSQQEAAKQQSQSEMAGRIAMAAAMA